MDILKELQSHIEYVYKDADMRKYTSLHIGGPADILIEACRKEDVLIAQKIAKENHLDFFVLGKGSNILVGDKGIRGIVLHIGNRFNKLSVNHNIIYAEAGAYLSELAKFAQKNSLAGLEFASGIPGTVGGAVVMNAGAYGGEMKNVVKYVDFIDKDGKLKRFNNEEMEFSYRNSALQNKGNIIIGVAYSLSKGNKEQIMQTILELNRRRAEKQPLEYPSCGSVFKRPIGNYASALIEQCGLKGYSIGGCSVSTKHAGFMINNGSATANEYLELIHTVQDVVQKKTKYKLDTEVRLVGEF